MTTTHLFLNHLKPIIYWCKILGVVFFPVNESSFLKWQKFLWFSPLFVYYIYSLYRGLNEFYAVRYSYMNDVIRTGDFFQVVFSAFHMTVRIIWNIKNSNSIKILLLKIERNAEVLNITSYTTIYKTLIELCLIELLIFTVDLTITLNQVVFTIFYYSSYAVTSYIGIFESYYIYLILNGIRKQFVAINEQLKSELNFERRKKPNYAYRIALSAQQTEGKVTENLIERIMDITHMYYKLRKISQKANRLFGMQILVALAVYLFYLVTNVHFLASFIRQIIIKPKFNIIIITVSCWNVLQMSLIISIILPWTAVKNEVRCFGSNFNKNSY